MRREASKTRSWMSQAAVDRLTDVTIDLLRETIAMDTADARRIVDTLFVGQLPAIKDREAVARAMVAFRDTEVSAVMSRLSAWMTKNGFATGHGDDVDALLRELTWQVEELRARAAPKNGS